MLCSFGPYFVSPVIAGLQPDLTPYLAGTDSIGAIETAKDFMVAGTAPDSLLGMCESMWRPDMVTFWKWPAEEHALSLPLMAWHAAGEVTEFCSSLQEAEDLFETVSQCLLSGVDRDALSGWGGIVHIM